METVLLSALFIFSLRILDISLYVMRLTMIMNGRKVLAWVFAFCQAMVFVLAIARVITNLDNPLLVLGYAAGFATGLVVGMLIENRIALGYIHLRIISPGLGVELAEQLRTQGYAVTEVSGRGKDGMVTILNLSIFRKDREQVLTKITEIDPEAMVTAESVRSVTNGFWGFKN